MHDKQINANTKTFALIMETGDDVSDRLKVFAESHQLSSSSFKAIGALSYVKPGWFNWECKRYQVAAEFSEQVELLSLIGDIALKEGARQVHSHATAGRRDGQVFGGHLLKAIVRPTCEVILTESPENLQKVVD